MPARKPSPIGVHVPTSSGLMRGALPYAQAVGAQAVQLFLGHPRGWTPTGDGDQDAAFARECRAGHIPVFVHAPHLINFASANPAIQERSATALKQVLARAGAIGAMGVVIHAGSASPDAAAAGRSAAREHGLARVREGLLPILETSHTALGNLRLLIEPTTAGAADLASTVEDLGPYLDALDYHPRVGVCLDTCHAYAAGHDLAAPGGIRRVLNVLVKTVGRGRLGLVHASDARDPLGSRRDRHAAVGVGAIGLDPFAELFVHPATRGVPVIIETPGGELQHRTDVQALKRLRDNSR